RPEPPQAARERLETPHVLDVRGEARHVHQIERPIAEDLVGDVRAVRGLDVTRLGWLHAPILTQIELTGATAREGPLTCPSVRECLLTVTPDAEGPRPGGPGECGAQTSSETLRRVEPSEEIRRIVHRWLVANRDGDAD